MAGKLATVAGTIDEISAVDLDQALAVAGIGQYNIKYCLCLALFLIAAIVEPVGYSFVLPAAICDLDMSNSVRGFIASVPYIGIVLTSFFWGYMVDTKGRRRVVIYASLACGSFSLLSAFMPELISFTICKFLTSLCLACPAAVPYTFIGEILPAKYRDVTLSVTNALQIGGAAMVPLLAWAFLPLDFRIDFGLYFFRPWRVLTVAYSSFFIIAAVLLSFGPESPKYLMSQGRHDEALKVLQTIYAGNKGKSPEDYPVKWLKSMDNRKQTSGLLTSLKDQTLPLLEAQYLKWMCLMGFLLFGIFSVLNGLYMWVPDVLNRVMSGTGVGMTACEVIAQRLNETDTGVCDDSIDPITFKIGSIANVSCAVIAVIVSSTVNVIGKKTLLITAYILIGTFCVLINFITQDVLFAVLLSSLPILGLAIGPVNAFAVEIFPTHLRGMAVSLCMMLGRFGSVVGTNLAGLLLNVACEFTFYGFGGLLIICGLLATLLPNTQSKPTGKLPKSKELTHL